MNEQDRIELLKAVAECAPKEMYLTFRWEFPCLEFCQGYGGNEVFKVVQGSRHTLTNDNHDARLIIAMLDAMESNGDYVSIYRVSGDKYYASTAASDRVMEQGKTRAEAVARAFVKVFGGKNG